MSEPRADALDRLDAAVGRAEAAALVGILGTMVVLATVQLVLRKVFSSGLEWADVVVRQMVLWVGFIGGAHATHLGRHIAIDALGRFLPPRRSAAVRAVSALVAAGVSGLLLVIATAYVREEHGAFFRGEVAFEGIDRLPYDAIMPVAFLAITFHFLVSARRWVAVARGRRDAPPEEEQA